MDRSQLQSLPGAGVGNFLYAIEFTQGIAKVGRTNNPRQRIGSLFNEARRAGFAPVKVIVRKTDSPITSAEHALVSELRAMDASVGLNGREWFKVESFAPVADAIRRVADTVESRGNRRDDWTRLVREARAALGLNQLQMARHLGISQPTLSQIERGLGPKNKPGAWSPSWDLGNRIKVVHREAKRKARKSQPTQQDA